MKTNHPTLRADEPVSKALDLLLSHRVLTVPVVDADGRYLGMFGKHRILSLLLPRAATLDEEMPSLASLLDVAFMTDNIDDIRERLTEISSDPVSKYIETDAPQVKANAPLMTALQLLYSTRNYLPVVDEDGKLAGVLSSWDALAKFAE